MFSGLEPKALRKVPLKQKNQALSFRFHTERFTRQNLMQITFKCSKCGSDKFEIPSTPTSSSQVTCGGCVGVETYGHLRKQAEDQAMKLIKGKLGNLFK
ncbi:ECs_2282 family putative zinc-binding protein [Pseudomonas sp.]|uniref:ECs_2282 family putative zinc-binding protein n=1 Tax=Pseudomonas sp. TaxID=306 RepID=UPI0039C9E118